MLVFLELSFAQERYSNALKKIVSDLTSLNTRIYSEIHDCLSRNKLTSDNFFEFLYLFQIASVTHLWLPYEKKRVQQHSELFSRLSDFDVQTIPKDILTIHHLDDCENIFASLDLLDIVTCKISFKIHW